MIAQEEVFKEETIRKAWKNSGINPLNPGIFTKGDYTLSYNTSTNLHLSETYPIDEPPSDAINLSSNDPTYEPTMESEYGSDSLDLEYSEMEGCMEDAGIGLILAPLPIGSRGPASEPMPSQDPHLSSTSTIPAFFSHHLQNEFSDPASHIQPPASRCSTVPLASHWKTHSQSRTTPFRFTTPTSCSVTPQPPSATEQLKMAEGWISELE